MFGVSGKDLVDESPILDAVLWIEESLKRFRKGGTVKEVSLEIEINDSYELSQLVDGIFAITGQKQLKDAVPGDLAVEIKLADVHSTDDFQKRKIVISYVGDKMDNYPEKRRAIFVFDKN